MNKRLKLGLIVGIINFVVVMFLFVISDVLVLFIPAVTVIRTLCLGLSFILTLPIMPVIINYVMPIISDGVFIQYVVYILTTLLNSIIWGVFAAYCIPKPQNKNES